MARSMLFITLLALVSMLSFHSPSFIPDGLGATTDTEIGDDGTVGGGPGL